MQHHLGGQPVLGPPCAGPRGGWSRTSTTLVVSHRPARAARRRGRAPRAARRAGSPRPARPPRALSTGSPSDCRPRTRHRLLAVRPASTSSSPTDTRPAPSVPVTTVPAPRMVKARSTQSRTSPSTSGAGSRRASAAERRPQVVETLRRSRPDTHTAGSRPEASTPPGAPGPRRAPSSGSARSERVTTSTPCRHAERVQRGEVLRRTAASSPRRRRPRTSPRAPDRPRPACCVTNRSWPGTSTNATGSVRRPASVQAKPRSIVIPRRRSSAHRSGSIPVSARTSVDLPWSTWPAVATTFTAPYCRVTRTARIAAARRASSAGVDRAQVEQAAAVLDARRRTGGVPPAAARRTRPAAPPPALGSSTPGAPPPPTAAAHCDDLGAAASCRGAAPRPARAARRASACSIAPRRRARAAQRGLQRGEGQLVHAQRPGQRVAAQPVHQLARVPSSSPACGPPSSLSPLAVTRSAPAAQRGRGVGLVGQRRVGREQAATRCRRRRAPRARPARAIGTAEVNPLTTEVRRVDLEDQPGVGADGRRRSRRRCTRLVVPTSRSRAPVDTSRSGQPEPVADLDHLAAGDDDLAPGGQRGRGEHQGRGAVVRRRAPPPASGTAARQRGQRAGPAAAALAGGEVELDVRGPRRGGDGVARRGRQRRPAQVGVQQHPAGVDHRAQARRGRPGSVASDLGSATASGAISPAPRRGPGRRRPPPSPGRPDGRHRGGDAGVGEDGVGARNPPPGVGRRGAHAVQDPLTGTGSPHRARRAGMNGAFVPKEGDERAVRAGRTRVPPRGSSARPQDPAAGT